MSIRVALNHKTLYRYTRPVWLSPHVVRLRPAPHCRTPIPSYSLRVAPADHFINWQQDPFANYCARVVLPEKTDRFVVTVDLVADMAVINPFDFFLAEEARARGITPVLTTSGLGLSGERAARQRGWKGASAP